MIGKNKKIQAMIQQLKKLTILMLKSELFH